eukprot:CAMPEP_0201523784 /NCGR_PEP_ID=MMETSP0161_2-20130828/20922_1 /ASSEMBLY_ACC=CAM_ASM_000251 /TAXON_ID=180227 /ORGANISM="Neoparamoeba aestuarina, Strain SoJaBio B1-5/56/2" /LENGTH=166 /DNA_ID=CAMNT_0047922993 /DNA_START=120 /DNA_END=620 /DNA_ORIENTATION=+
MELLIEKTTKKRVACRDDDTPWELHEWWGLVMHKKTGVRKIAWSCFRMGGSIQLEWLPNTVVEAFFNDNSFEGTVTLLGLPESLQCLSVSHNNLSGTVDLMNLPENLREISLQKNSFEGDTDFSQLPASLKYIDVSDTKLEGKIQRRRGMLIGTSNSKVEIIPMKR